MEYRIALEEDHEDNTDGDLLTDDVDGRYALTAGSADDDSTLKYRVDDKDGTLQGYIFDDTDSDYFQLTYTLRKARDPVNGLMLEMEITLPAATSGSNNYVYFGMLDGSTLLCAVLINLNDGSVSAYRNYGLPETPQWIDTGADMNLSASNKLKFVINSFTSYHLYINDIKVSTTAYNNPNGTAWDTFDGIYIKTENANDDTLEAWFDNVFVFEPREEPSIRIPSQFHVEAFASFPAGSYPLKQSDGSILLLSNGNKLYRVTTTTTEYDTWTDVSDGITWYCFVACKTSTPGTLYACGYRTSGSGNLFYKSTDYGVNWVAMGSYGDASSICVDVFEIDSEIYSIALEINSINVRKLTDEGTPTWTSQDTQAVTISPTRLFGKGFVEGDIYYFACIDGTDVKFWKYDDTGPTISVIATISSTYILSSDILSTADDYGDPYFPMLRSRDISFDDGGSAGIAFITLTYNINTHALFKTDDGGNTWTKLYDDVKIRFSPDGFIDSDDELLGYDWRTSDLYEYDEDNDEWIKLYQMNTVIPNATNSRIYLAIDGYLPILFVSYPSTYLSWSVFSLFESVDVIATSDLIFKANGDPDEGKIVFRPEYYETFVSGNIMKFYDGFGECCYYGHLELQETMAAKSSRSVIVKTFKDELERTFNSSFSAQRTDQILESLIGSLSFLYEDSTIETTTTAYTYKVQTSLRDFTELAREMEKALFYVTPERKCYFKTQANAVATGYRWSENSKGAIKLLYYTTDTLRLTKSEVVGGQNTSGQVRVVHEGNATLGYAGDRLIQLVDPNIMNHTECNQLATNRYTIYSADYTVVELLVKNFGFIQPGESVIFSWTDGRATIPRGTYYIMQWKYDFTMDVNHVWLVNNIITPPEFEAVKTSIGKSTAIITSTYYDGQNVSTSDGTPVAQNPVNLLTKGTYVWRPTEPTAEDFDKADLHALGGGSVADTWYDLDLSSIIPSGARSVHLRCCATDSAAGKRLLFRRNGQSYEIQTECCISHVAGQNIYDNPIVGLDNNRIIEINSKDQNFNSWTSIYLTVLGWWV